MRPLLKRAPCGTAVIAVLLLQPVAASLCAAACGQEVSAAQQEEAEAAASHCAGEETRSEPDRHPCDGHVQVRSATTAAPRKASLSAGREIAAMLGSPVCAERLGVLEPLVRTFPVSHPSRVPPRHSVLRL